MVLYLCPVIYRTFQQEIAMSEDNLQKYQLRLSMVGHQDTSRGPDKSQSGIYAAIPLQILLEHTIVGNENHCTVK